MKIGSLEEIRYAFQNVGHRKTRSFLTVLSIFIGVMAVFALVSFGLGIKNYMDTLAAQAGGDKLFIMAKGIGAPGTDQNFYLSKDDIDFVKKINGVNDAVGLYMKAGEIEYKNQKKYNFVMGFDPEKREFIEEASTIKIYKGRPLAKGDNDEVFLGYNYQIDNKIFKKGLDVGDRIKLDGTEYTVAGFYSEVGNPSDDAQIYLTSEAMEQLYPATKDKFGYVMLKSDAEIATKELAEKIQDKLRKHKGQEKGKEDFYVQTFEDLLQTFGTIINILNVVLILIALISLIVAAVNIMNTMYTAVLERTKEIGIMKAVGARNSDILFIFVIESGLLGMIGGIVGVGLGYVVAVTGGQIAAAAGYSLLKPIFPWYLTLGCILFAFFVGTIAGILPAIQASKLKPVDALRYE